MDILCKSLIFFKTQYKIKTKNLIHISHEDNKALIDKLQDNIIIMAKMALNSSKVKRKFDLIEFYDSKINHMRLHGLKEFETSEKVYTSSQISNGSLNGVENYNFLSSFINSKK